MIILQSIQQFRAKAKISLHKLIRVVGTINAGKIKYKIRFFAIRMQLVFRAVHIVFKNLQFAWVTHAVPSMSAVPAVFYGFQGFHKITADKPLGTRHQNMKTH